MDTNVAPWELYERHVDLWIRNRPPGITFERQWLSRFTERLAPNARILDVGCGHGQPIAAQLLASGFRVWGIDRAPSLIAAAQANLPDGMWQVADMATLDLGQTFDGIVMWHSLFHLTATEQRAVFRQLAAHAQPGTLLLFTSGHRAGSSNGEFGGEVLAHHSLDAHEYRDLLAAHGFAVLDYREVDPECGNATVWFAEISREP